MTIHQLYLPLKRILREIKINTLPYVKTDNGTVGIVPPKPSHAHMIVKMSPMEHTYLKTAKINNYS